MDIPETRYAPTPDGGFIAYKAIGEGSEAEDRLAIIRRFLGVERLHPVFDRVLATVMFTDIVDSTAAAARLGDWHGTACWTRTTRSPSSQSRATEVD